MFALYKKGFSHIVDGVQCTVGRFSFEDLENARADGWVDDVKMLESPKPKRKVKHEDEGATD